MTRGMGRRALGAAVLALLAGCGGADTDPDSGRYVRQVDRLCRQTKPKLAAINTSLVKARDAARAGQVGPAQTFGTFERLLRRASAITRRFEARLEKVAPPAGEEDFHEALIQAVGKGSSNLREQVSAAQRRDAAALRDLSVEGSRQNARNKGLIEGHGGFRVCG